MRRILPWLIFICSAFFITGLLLISIEGFTKSINCPEWLLSAGPNKTKTIKVVLVGDMMLDRGVEYMVETEGGGDYRFPFLKIAPELQKADIVFGNLEGPISDKGVKVGSVYSFRAKSEAIDGLAYAGFDILSLANNHAFDYGREALDDCKALLSNAGIDYVGFGVPVIKEVQSTKIAFLAYTNSGLPSWGIGWADWNNLEKIKKEIEETKKAADILIVSLHAGEEYQKTPSQFQIDFFKMAVESGADIVFGHHPHVVQPDLYSLGNFIFDQGFSKETMQGKMAKVIIKNKKIEEVIPTDTKINEFFQPEIVDNYKF